MSSLTSLDETEKGGDAWFASVCLASLVFAAAYVLVEVKPEGFFNVVAYILALAALGAGTVILIRNLLAPYFDNSKSPPDS